MKKSQAVFLVLLLTLLFAGSSFGQGAASKSLVVKCSYSGQGEVNSNYQIHLFVFDTPDINAGAMPISWASATENGQEVSFSGLYAEKVYLVGAYGDYDATMGPPPSGTPVSFYKPGSPAPSAIELNESKVEVEFEFDDSVRMP